MAAMKLVKYLLLLGFLLYAKAVYVKGSRGGSEEVSDAPAGHIVYDQRQTGKYNIHVVIKDVAIIEMDQNEIADQNYNDEEYYYDEDDLTVKPLHIKTTTTTRPLNSTSTKTPMTTSTQTLVETTTDKPYTESTTFLKTSSEISTTNSHPPSTQISTDKEQDENLNKFTTSYVPAVVDTKPRSKIEPIYAVEDEDTLLQSRHNMDEFDYSLSSPIQSRDNSYSMKSNMNNFKNSRIYKVKVQRSQQPPLRSSPSRRCRSHQYRDARGNCHGKRSSSGSGSILKRLFKMLITLPFRQDEEQPGVY